MMTPTLFSVSYAGLWGQHRLDPVQFIDKAARLGYSAVELMGKRPHLSVVDTTDDQLSRIRDAAGDRSPDIALHRGGTLGCNRLTVRSSHRFPEHPSYAGRDTEFRVCTGRGPQIAGPETDLLFRLIAAGNAGMT